MNDLIPSTEHMLATSDQQPDRRSHENPLWCSTATPARALPDGGHPGRPAGPAARGDRVPAGCRRCYTSTVLIRVAPQITLFMPSEKLQEAQVPPFFESFVATQASLVGSRRVLDMAVADPKLRAAGWPGAPEGLALLSRSLDISNRRATELIVATVRHKKPEAGPEGRQRRPRGLRHGPRGDQLDQHYAKETALVERQRQLQREIESYRGQMTELSSQYATADVEEFHVAKLGEIVKLDNKSRPSTWPSPSGARAMRRRRPGRDRHRRPGDRAGRPDIREAPGSEGRHQDRDGPHAPGLSPRSTASTRPEEPPRRRGGASWTRPAPSAWACPTTTARPAPTPRHCPSSS